VQRSKNITTAKEMWDIMKADATEKSMLCLIDAEDMLLSMRCSDSSNPKTHLTEIKAHFDLMVQGCDSLTEMGSTLSDTQFSTMIMSSLPASYRPALQTITAAERVQSAQPLEAKKGEKKPMETAVVATDANLFAFSCTSDYVEIAQGLDLLTTKLGGSIVDTGASSHFCPDQTKFQNYRPLIGRSIHAADGRSHVAARVGDVIIQLPNGDKCGPVRTWILIHIVISWSSP
jgi:hypothetical protein